MCLADLSHILIYNWSFHTRVLICFEEDYNKQNGFKTNEDRNQTLVVKQLAKNKVTRYSKIFHYKKIWALKKFIKYMALKCLHNVCKPEAIIIIIMITRKTLKNVIKCMTFNCLHNGCNPEAKGSK